MGVIPLNKMTRKHYTLLGATGHQEILNLLSYGLTTKQVSKITGRSWGTIKNIKGTTDLADYKKKMHSLYAQKKEKVELDTNNEVAESPKSDDFDDHNSSVTLLNIFQSIEKSQKEVIRILELIQNNTSKKNFFN